MSVRNNHPRRQDLRQPEIIVKPSGVKASHEDAENVYRAVFLAMGATLRRRAWILIRARL
jgi:hypothetical protein